MLKRGNSGSRRVPNGFPDLLLSAESWCSASGRQEEETEEHLFQRWTVPAPPGLLP